MCENEPSVISKLNIEDVMNLRKASATLQTAKECEKFDLQIPRKYFLHGSGNRLKSRSDGDLYQISNNYKSLARYTDFEVSSFPSGSDITVIRVLKRSRVQGTPSRTVEGILGDGSHLPESLSMVNLATLVQGIPVSCREELLIPLSSWDSPINRTASDTTVQSAMHVAAYSWVNAAFSQLEQASSSALVNDRFFPRNVVAGLSELMIINNKSLSNCNDRGGIKPRNLNEELIMIGGNELVEEQIVNRTDIDDKIEFIKDKSTVKNCRSEKLFARLSARIQKTFRRAVQCSCFPAVRRSDKCKFDTADIN